MGSPDVLSSALLPAHPASARSPAAAASGVQTNPDNPTPSPAIHCVTLGKSLTSSHLNFFCPRMEVIRSDCGKRVSNSVAESGSQHTAAHRPDLACHLFPRDLKAKKGVCISKRLKGKNSKEKEYFMTLKMTGNSHFIVSE